MANVPSAQDVARIARKWAEKHPNLATRIERAVALVALVTPGDLPHVFFVEGSEGRRYVVRVDGRASTCTCPDSGTGHHCKHRLAAALFVAGQKKTP